LVQPGTGDAPWLTYEAMLDSNLELALMEGSMFFEDRGAVQETLRRICSRLEELGIPYAVAGGMALFAHGLRRFTENVDILVTAESLARIHDELEGRGYLPPFAGSRHLRDTSTHVKIEFLVTGGFPGDGKPKPVAFPDPTAVAEVHDGIRFVSLPKLIELKVASGMTASHRTKDLVDVEELIQTLRLPRSFGEGLDASVRSRFHELWDVRQPTVVRYVRLVREDDESDLAQRMLADGVELETRPDQTLMPGISLYITTDAALAARYEMVPESEFFKEGK
jgi:hypothetical protein